MKMSRVKRSVAAGFALLMLVGGATVVTGAPAEAKDTNWPCKGC